MAAIASVEVSFFTTLARTAVDPHGHRHPAEPHEVREALLTVTDVDGAAGRVLVQPDHLRPHVLEKYVRPALLGQEALERERLWTALARRQRGAGGGLTDRALCFVDLALWDLAGQRLGQPVWRLLGGARREVPAYASTMCGDELPGGLATPADYADFAVRLVEQGYRAIKLHTWMPPVAGAPSVALDIAACTAVREAVGPDVELMLDANHWYSRTEALRLGRALQELGFYWLEEPMEEASVSSYRWLAEQLEIPVIGPETSWGKNFTRAEWAASGACDILRTGTTDVGGLTPAVRTLHLAEAFNLDCEVHGNGSGNLALLGATTNARWYERGLLHPLVDFDLLPPHLNSAVDPIDGRGVVVFPERPGLGDDFDLDYIKSHTVEVS
ncbi:enolase C-terminal domain-like protein [Kitasatospora sp. NRRL B-11411]|uniref:enolase C-terminal domain-like protein n=1 Tax=Kitasatospora sp. NRRL B-11411 TaxID=1463822 RepID=UPI0004C36AD1|nr:enolase C-terminal domain-like protein [Kitasatospora sp. NRRL B-11411]